MAESGPSLVDPGQILLDAIGPNLVDPETILAQSCTIRCNIGKIGHARAKFADAGPLWRRLVDIVPDLGVLQEAESSVPTASKPSGPSTNLLG